VKGSPYQALVFDLGGVIVAHDNAMLYARLASRCAPSWSSERISDFVRHGRWGRGEPISSLHATLTEQAGYDAPWPTFVEDWCRHLSLDASMLGLVEDLTAHNRVLIFSNTNKEHWEHVVALSHGALKRFESYLSHEIGHEKPAVESFHIVAARAGIEPAHAIFIDDLADNVRGARLAGFQAEVFEGRPKLEALLTARGVALR
jgi:HAD superfamily hydrolase (TIGR01509 family)